MSKSILTLRAPAKINLALDVLRRREDGYHDLRMVMQSVSLYDELTITLREDGFFTGSSNLPHLPRGDKNIAVRAARLFMERAGLTQQGCSLYVHKNIPVCAGMGGGSVDAAAVLRALQMHFGEPLSAAALCDLAASLGSDVPFCLMGGTALAEGRGELLTPLTPLPDCCFALCTPSVGVSTAVAFQSLRVNRIRYRPDWPGLLAALRRRDLGGIARRAFNVFEAPLAARRDLAEIRTALAGSGALGVVMSGTGSTMVGIFDKEVTARAAVSSLLERYPQTFLAKPV